MILENPLPLTIHHDWNRIRKVYHKLINHYHDGFFDNTKQQIVRGNYIACDIGHYGRLAVSDFLTKDVWFIWTGRLLESLIPFAGILRSKTHAAGINLQNFGYHCHNGNIYRHVDSKQDFEIDCQSNQCNVNFVIVSHDAYSKSCFEYQDGIHYYTGKANCAYLLDSSVPHWVENNDHREVLQIRFHSSYRDVNEFFKNNPMKLS